MHQPPIAIVGVSALFPGSNSVGGFWRDIISGRDRISDVPPTHWLVEDYYDADPKAPDKTYGKRGGFLQPQLFDPREFGIPPNILPATDSSQLLALLVAKRLLADVAGDRTTPLDRSRVAVVLGVASGTGTQNEIAGRLQRPVWANALRKGGLPDSQIEAICDEIAGSFVPFREDTLPGLLGNVTAGRIANRLDLHGANYSLDAACASSLAAISLAMKELACGEADLVIAGGVDTRNDPPMFISFSKTPALSRSGDCRPYSAEGDGTLLGEGLGMFALKRLTDAERDGDRIYAVIRGVGASSDGSSKSIYAPSSDGQMLALRRCYEAAGYLPRTVELVEGHGTGTKAGDSAEVRALSAVFREGEREVRQWCALGSVKSQIGHTKAAAGAAGLLKAVLALHHHTLPGTIKVASPNPGADFERSPFYLNTRSRPWIRGHSHPRRASVSAFGFGGSNFHLTVEDAKARHLARCVYER